MLPLIGSFFPHFQHTFNNAKGQEERRKEGKTGVPALPWHCCSSAQGRSVPRWWSRASSRRGVWLGLLCPVPFAAVCSFQISSKSENRRGKEIAFSWLSREPEPSSPTIPNCSCNPPVAPQALAGWEGWAWGDHRSPSLLGSLC